MKIAQSQLCVLTALASVVGLYVAPALAGDDKSTVTTVMELVGVSSDSDVAKIDYSERPKLVLPPNRGALPEPQAQANRPGGWPAEMATERRRNGDRYARIGNAPQEKRPGLLERALASGQGSSAPVVDEPSRAMLTEPPAGYRRPTQDLSKIQDPDAKKGSWWNPMSWGGGGQSTVAQNGQARPEEQGAISSLRRMTGFNSSESATISTSRAQQASSSDSGSLFQMPRFVRGSDDTR